MSRPMVEKTEKLGLIPCSCGMCQNVDRFEKLQSEIKRLEKHNEDLKIVYNSRNVRVSELSKVVERLEEVISSRLSSSDKDT